MPVAATPVHHVPMPARARIGRRERAIVRRFNEIRRRRGLPRLRFSRRLGFIAALHSYDLASHNQLSHSSSTGVPFAQRVGSLVDARVIGETIAQTVGRDSAGVIVRAWMRSPAHRAEILAPSFRRVGVASASSRFGVVTTADFASGR